MPRGTRHTLTGTLGWNERNRIHVLNMEGGGYWFVDMPGRTRHLIGREVTVEGMRSGFNLLDVHRLLAIDGAPVRSRREELLALLRKQLEVISSC